MVVSRPKDSVLDIYLLRQSIHTAARPEFSRSGGPGGQNVNKVNTKVCLRVKIEDLMGLSEAEYKHLRETLASRITGEGELVINASEERSQRTNLERAYARLEALAVSAARLPKKRRPTKPSKAAREERLRAKRLRGLKKAGRSHSPEDV
jgi:ribosome-associated protein